jgi:hypothetical protein
MKLIIKIIILTIVSSLNAQELTSFDFNSININNWMNTPHVKGRLATQDDVEQNRAVYISSGIGKYIPVDLEIPFLACLIDPRTERKDTVVVIQAHKIDGGVYTGFRAFHGIGHGTSLLKDLIIIDNYEGNLNIASEFYLKNEEIPESVLIKLVPKNFTKFGIYYGTTGPDHKLGKTDFFYETTRLIFEKVTSDKNNDFYIPSLKLISFADGEFAEDFIYYLELIIKMDKDKFCKSISGKEYVKRNPIKYYSELNKCK